MGTPRSDSATSCMLHWRGCTRALTFSSVSWSRRFVLHDTNRLQPYSSYRQLFAAPKKKKIKKNEKKIAPMLQHLHFIFSGKVILAAVNLPSQITLLTLRISYVFSSLSSLNLPLSCPELSVASRARRSTVFKVDVWGRNRANTDVAHGFLPSASFSPQACGDCQLPLVSNSLTKPTPTRLHHSLLWGSRCVITQLRYAWGAQTLHHHHHRAASEGDRQSTRHIHHRVIEKAKYLLLHMTQ